MTERIALITGASHGLGRALATALASEGWRLIITARGAEDLAAVERRLGPNVSAVPGDVTDSWHRMALVDLTDRLGGLDLLVNNAAMLGPTPMPRLSDYPADALTQVFQVNVLAPLEMIQATLPYLRSRRGAVLNITSDAAVEAYETWGGYGLSKAALDQLSNVLAAEEPGLRIWSVDPGEMRTRTLAAAMPGEDLSEFPEPETVVPALLALLLEKAPSGRYTAAGLGAAP